MKTSCIKRKIKGNKKAAMLLYITTFALLIASFGFLVIKVSEKPEKWEPKYIGEHQIALLKTAVNAQKFLLYIDQAANPTAMQSIYNLADKGGYPAGSDCGKYFGYQSWRGISNETEIKNCFPDETSIKYDLAAALNNEIYKYLNVYWGKAALIPADMPQGVLGKMPPSNYEVSLEQKNQLKINAIAKENAEFDIIIGPIEKKGMQAALDVAGEAVEDVVRGGMKIVNYQNCEILEPQTDSQSTGSTSASSGKLENAAEIPMGGPYHLVNPIARSRKRNYATNELYIVIQKIGCATMQAYNTKITFNDVSKKGGGNIGHKSHASGRDIDLGFICQKDGNRYPCYKNVVKGTGVVPEFDPAGNWEMVKAMLQISKVRFIFLNPKIIKSIIDWAEVNEANKTIVKKAKSSLNPMNNHVTHYHLRIHCPEGDTRCRT